MSEPKEPPYNYCWQCSGKLMRVTTGERKGKLAFRVVEVDGIARYVHAECEDEAREWADELSEGPA